MCVRYTSECVPGKSTQRKGTAQNVGLTADLSVQPTPSVLQKSFSVCI